MTQVLEVVVHSAPQTFWFIGPGEKILFEPFEHRLDLFDLIVYLVNLRRNNRHGDDFAELLVILHDLLRVRLELHFKLLLLQHVSRNILASHVIQLFRHLNLEKFFQLLCTFLGLYEHRILRIVLDV